MEQKYLQTKPHYAILDGLRGVGAIIIVVYHLFEGCGIRFGHAYLGVDFFYALSGFVIGYAYDDRWNKMNVWGFFKRRITRLHPMLVMGSFLAFLFFYFSECSVFPYVVQTPWWKAVLLLIWVCVMLPMPNSWDIKGWQDFNSFNGNSWSLYWEYFANILYALVLRRMSVLLMSVFAVVSAVGVLDLTLNMDIFGLLKARVGWPNTVNGGWSLTPSELYVGAVRLAYPFLAGLLLSRLKFFIKVRHAFFWSSVFIAAIMLMPVMDGLANGAFEALSVLVFIPLIVSIGAGGGRVEGGKSEKFCKFLGEISYPLYITHQAFICMQIAWVANHPNAPAGTVALVSVSMFVASFATAYALLKLYDIPLREWLKRHWLARAC